MVVADLHVHTTNSDGELTLAELPTAARAAGVDVVAVTDHDRPHPELSAPVERRDGVAVVHGIELRVATGDGRVDLLGYGLDPTTALEREVERLQADRAERAARMLDLVEAEIGVRLDVEPGPGIGRPHLARALAARPDLDYDVQRAFDELLGHDCPCYVARDVPSFERGRALLAESARLVGLAHPLRYDDVEGALGLLAELDAAELYYPYERPVDPADGDVGGPDSSGRERVARAIRRHDALATGGSDAHGTELGLAGLDGDAFEPVGDALGLEARS